ncbi:MFS transporter [Chitinibacter sp. GC72]|uniref:MFS transporter n=1 Tax=Chitinibacter sp. GC72 TaxID=1526917 RepID=UPI0012F8AEFD|nr:MFS transporter [Chitinibacter sp. GC72]
MSTPDSVPNAIPAPVHQPAHPSTHHLAAAQLALALSTLLASLGISIANVGLPALAQAFAASFQAVQWVVLAYLLAITSLIVGVGRLGDLLGRRRLLLIGLLLFSLASLAGGLASNLALLIAARFVQGLGAAMMMALSMALIGETLGSAKAGRAMGLLGSMSAVGTALGPSLGGVLIDALGWRAIFLLTAPLGMLALLLAWRYLPAAPPSDKQSTSRFDYTGTLLLAATLAAYALAMTQRQFGLSSWLMLAAAGLALLVWQQKRSTAPLIQLALFRQHALAASLMMNGIVAALVMTLLVVGPFYLAQAFGLNVRQTGLVLAIGPAVAALCGVPAGYVVDHLGAAKITRLALLGIFGGTLALSLMPLHWGLAGYIAPVVLITASYAFFMVGNNTATLANIPATQRGLISGLLNLSRNLGLISGASLMAAVFAWASQQASHTSAQTAASGMHTTFQLATALVTIALLIAFRMRGRG